MAFDLFAFVDLYRRQLAIARHLLHKGAEHAASLGVSEADLFGWRLADDMHPLSFQLSTVITFTQQWPARAAGLPVPDRVAPEPSVAAFDAAIAAADRFLATLDPAGFAANEDQPLRVQLNETIAPTLPTGRWLSDFATTNIYFHTSIAYAILRLKGVPLGKVDMFPSGF